MAEDAQRNRAGSVSRSILRADPGSVMVNHDQADGAGKEFAMSTFYSAGSGAK